MCQFVQISVTMKLTGLSMSWMQCFVRIHHPGLMFYAEKCLFGTTGGGLMMHWWTGLMWRCPKRHWTLLSKHQCQGSQMGFSKLPGDSRMSCDWVEMTDGWRQVPSHLYSNVSQPWHFKLVLHSHSKCFQSNIKSDQSFPDRYMHTWTIETCPPMGLTPLSSLARMLWQQSSWRLCEARIV